MAGKFKSFRDWSIATKLNVLLGLMTLAVIVVATFWVASSVRGKMEAKALADLQRINDLTLNMIDANSRNLRNDVERNARVFAGLFERPALAPTIVPAVMVPTDPVAPSNDVPATEAASPDAVDATAPAITVLVAPEPPPVPDDTAIIDDFSARSGLVASVFERQGTSYQRTATSVKDQNGARALGSTLPAGHPAIAALDAGKPFTGKATLLGHDYITHYLPIKDTSGAVTGAYAVGLDMGEALKTLKQEILSIKVGETGYVYAVDAGAHPGVLAVHPVSEGKDLIDAKDADGKPFIRDIVERKTGVMRYNWANQGETSARPKIAVFTEYRDWNWIVVTGSYLNEFTAIADAVTRSIAIMAAGILIAIGLVCFFFTRRWITRPLLGVVRETERIAGGDLALTVRADSRDELGQMQQAIGRMTESLKGIIGETRRASGLMLDQSLQLVSAAEQVSASSQAQSDSASSMAASVEEMSVSINQVAQHADDASRISTAAGKTANEGAEVIQSATSAMEKIADTVRQAATKLSELGEHAQGISSIVAVIREIADQTNLLALNAAIEAARAGEQGRGFAVVADEVRKLAERTTSSTQSIVERINSIQIGTKQAIDTMQDGVAQVEHGSVLASDAGTAIEKIHGGSREVIDAVGSIANAINEQSLATQTIAQGLEAIALKAEANHSASQSSAQSAKALRDMATALDRTLGFFKVE